MFCVSVLGDRKGAVSPIFLASFLSPGAGAAAGQIHTNTMSVEDQKFNIELLEDIKSPRVQKDEVLVNAAGSIQRLPVPSNDVNDPLNFTVWEKAGVIVSCCWFCKRLLSL